MAVLEYATIFSNVLRELYGQELTCNDLYNSNSDIQVVNGKYVKIPTLSVTGYKDHTRGGAYNTGNYSNESEVYELDFDRDVEFIIDPMDVDETNMVVSIGNVQKRFEKKQAIPELDCYTYSKLYTEASRVGATIKTTALTPSNVLADFDENLSKFEDAGVPLERVIMYCTTDYKTILKNAEGIQRTLDIKSGGGIDRRIHSMDDIKKIVTVPKSRFKTAYNFTNGFEPDTDAKQMDYILVDPEAQVSRIKHAYINVFTPGHDSRTADNYMYQNRRFNGTRAIKELYVDGCVIHTQA